MAREDALPDMAYLADSEETKFAAAGEGISPDADGIAGRRLAEGSLLLMGFEGTKERVTHRRRLAIRHARGNSTSLGSGPAERWSRERFELPYLRDSLRDHGILVDTVETAASWSELLAVYDHAKKALAEALWKDGTAGLVLCHVSHAYPDGASLYYTFLAPQREGREIEQWEAIKAAVTEALLDAGGALSHHHGIGEDHAPYLARVIGEDGLVVLRALRDRDLLLHNAQGLVHPLPFLIPSYADRGPGRALLRFGLFLYDFLSREKTLPRRLWLSPTEAREREPQIAGEELAGAGLYYDAWTDDSRLVLAVVQDAADAGAIVANHIRVEGLIRESDRIVGAHLRDAMTDDSFTTSSRFVVNATGVWLDDLRTGRSTPTIRPTKGIHIFLARAKVGNRHALALTARRDGRVVFVLPWGDLTLVGTTDTDFRGNPDSVVPDAGDVAHLLEPVNATFPAAHLGPDDVVSAYAGLRPLLRRGREKAESDISRDHAIFEDGDGLISVTGGKLTTHRAMAEEVGGLLARRLGRPRASVTRDRPLGPPIRPLGEFMDLGFDEETALHLQRRYAPEQVERHMGGPSATERLVLARPYTWVEVEIAVHDEMAMTLGDVLVRRLGLF